MASLAQGGLSLTNTSALLSRWFQRKRATVIGLNSTALSLGGLVMVPFAYFLMTATDSWRIAWVGLGAVVLITLPVGWMFIRDNPSQMNLLPDGDEESGQQNSGNQRERVPGPLEVTSWRDSLRSWPFWQMSGAYFVCGATTFILSVHFIPYAMDRGASGGQAALIFAVMNGLNIVGATAAGYLSDKVGGTKNWLTLVYISRGLAYLLLLLTPLMGVMAIGGIGITVNWNILGLWVFACIAGFSWVATLPLTSSLTAEVYGLRASGNNFGNQFPVPSSRWFCKRHAGRVAVRRDRFLHPALRHHRLFAGAGGAFGLQHTREEVLGQVPAATHGLGGRCLASLRYWARSCCTRATPPTLS